MSRSAIHALACGLALALGCGADGDAGSRVAGLLHELAGRFGWGAATESAPAAADPAAPAAGDADDGALASLARTLGVADEEPATGPGYWRYTEPSGSVRFVETLAEVPAAARADAEHIASSAPSRPARAARAARAAPTRTARPAAAPARRAWSAPPAAPERRADPTVVVYTAPWCGWCRKTLAWLDARGVDYENRDIESNPAWAEELRRKTGRQSIPVVDVDGRLVRGFDERTLEELL